MIHTFLAGSGEMADAAALASLHVGARLGLRLGRTPTRTGSRSIVEVRALDGRTLGYLPPGDAEAVAGVLASGSTVSARVRGLVPAFQRPRVQLVVDLGDGGEAL
jgi:hypothetical protein